jgi:osmoprotectant transport system ATP-binding protein
MSMPEQPTAISLDGATYRIESKALVEGLSFEVGPSETVVLLGRSGSGKTTALRLVNGLHTPTEGRVLVQGRATTEWDPIALRRGIGYVIQEVGLFPHFTVADNIGLVPRLEGWPREKRRARIEGLLEKVGLRDGGILDRYPHQLSGGQRQRVGVARALAADPPILLMDEPFGALDPITRSELQREFQSMQQALDKAVLFVTHDIREALLLGRRIGVMESGRLIWMGLVEEFRESDDARIVELRDSQG